MNRDIIYSVALHILIVAGLTFNMTTIIKKPELGEVIRVSLASDIPSLAELEPTPLQPIEVPQAVEDEIDEIPLDDPTTAPKEKIKPKPEKPKEKPKPKKEVTKQPNQSNNTSGDAEQSKEVQTNEGSPFSGATVTDASFDYPYWFTQIFYKINQNWKNPVAADFAIVSVISFEVLSSGRIIEAKVQTSSGYAIFDNACLRAVELSSPLPPLPKDFNSEIIGITIPFKFDP